MFCCIYFCTRVPFFYKGGKVVAILKELSSVQRLNLNASDMWMRFGYGAVINLNKLQLSIRLQGAELKKLSGISQDSKRFTFSYLVLKYFCSCNH